MRLEAPRQPKCRRIHCRLPTGPIDKLKEKQIPLENLFIHIGTHKNYTSKHRGGCGELPPKRNCAQREVDSLFFFLCPPYEGVTGGPIVVYNPGRGSDKIRFDRPSDFFFLDLNVGGPSYPICFFFKDNSIWEDSKQKKRRGLTSSGGWRAITILVSGYGWRSRGNAVCC